MTSKISQKDLSNRITEKEKQIKSFSRKKDVSQSAVATLRKSYQEDCEALFETYFEAFLDQDIDSSLWKVIFHKKIEDYRKKITKTLDAESKGKLPEGNSSSEILLRRFRSFLEEVRTFYNRVIIKIRMLGPTSTNNKPSHQRCLTYLGDIDRYSYSYRDGEKDWTPVISHYELAARVWPANGTPHNQLAVVSCLTGDYLGAVYYYMRARHAAIPFPTAKTNLSTLFEGQRSMAPVPSRGIAAAVMPKMDFIPGIIELFSFLFNATDLDKFNDRNQKVLNNMKELMTSRSLTRTQTLRLMVIGVSLIYPPASDKDNDAIPTIRVEAVRSRATYLAFAMGTIICKSITVSNTTHLPAILVFVEWLVSRLDFIHALRATSLSSDLAIDFLSSFADVVNELTPSASHTFEDPSCFNNLILPEEVELLGFVPTSSTNSSLLIPESRLLDPLSSSLEDDHDQLCDFFRILKLNKVAGMMSKASPSILHLNSRGCYSVEDPDMDTAPEDMATFGDSDMNLTDDLNPFSRTAPPPREDYDVGMYDDANGPEPGTSWVGPLVSEQSNSFSDSFIPPRLAAANLKQPLAPAPPVPVAPAPAAVANPRLNNDDNDEEEDLDGDGEEEFIVLKPSRRSLEQTGNGQLSDADRKAVANFSAAKLLTPQYAAAGSSPGDSFFSNPAHRASSGNLPNPSGASLWAAGTNDTWRHSAPAAGYNPFNNSWTPYANAALAVPSQPPLNPPPQPQQQPQHFGFMNQFQTRNPFHDS